MTQQTNTKSDNHPSDSYHNPTADWDGLIYTFCWHSKEEQSNGYYPQYCIDSWGKDNTLMLMEMYKDYNYSITVRKHVFPVEN